MPPGRFKLAILMATSIVLAGFMLFDLSSRANLSGKFRNVSTSESWDGFRSWEQLRPSRDLVWRNCAPGRQCARLIVPLDYSNQDSGGEAVIALVRKPAVVPKDSKLYRGPILFNPGGPGASGVDFIIGETGDLFSTILGPEFDLIGFDPRGIARSIPRVSFFKTDIERSLFDYVSLPLVNGSDEGIHRTLARAKIVGQLAAEADSGYLRHINTDYTARDMLRIVEAHGRSKLQYWGFSYGTVLGATFAAMFPDKIERMVLDGVADAEDHYGVERRGTSLIDTDKIFDAFLTGCAGAGPENCQFWAPTADDIRQNLAVIMKHIRSHPMPIKTDSTYGILDYKKLRRTIFSTLFNPYTYFPALAKALSELAAGNGTAIYTLVPSRKAPECHCEGESRTPKNDIIADAPTTIICNDGEEIQEDIDALEAHLQLTMKASQWGDFWASIRFGCLGWPKFPAMQFRGPFEGKTSHPILMIGNTADPVTPLSSARKMAQGFEGSVVLQQNSLGHCSLAAPSPCTHRHVRNYFVDGILPPEGTVCEPDAELFPVADSLQGHISTEAQQYLDSQPTHSQGREFVQAVVGLSKLDIVAVYF